MKTEAAVKKPRAKKEKAPKKERATKVKVEIPAVPQASRLDVKGEDLPGRVKNVMKSFWSVDGTAGLYGFERNLKPTEVAAALKESGHGHVVASFQANPTSTTPNYGVFIRESALEKAIGKALAG